MTQLVFTERHNSDSEKWRKYSAHGDAGDSIIPAWIADSDYAAAPPIVAAIQQRAAHGVFGYCQPPDSLAPAICGYFARRWNWRIQPEWILYSPGLGAAIHNSCRMAAGGGILTPQPIYHAFRKAPPLANAKRLDMPMQLDASGEWQLPAAAMEDALAAGGGAAGCRIFQLCNPHNPNGKVFSRDELLAIGEFCIKHDLLIFSDEVHADLILDDERPHIPIASLSEEIAARTITLQSPSKAYNVAGLNMACIIIPNAQLRQRYQAAAQGKVLAHLNPFGYAACAAAYEDESGECESWLRAQTAHLRANRDTLRQAINALPGISMPPLPATYLAWINIAALNLPDAPAHFLRHGLALSSGDSFGDPAHIRLNFACTPQRLQDIIARFTAAVKSA